MISPLRLIPCVTAFLLLIAASTKVEARPGSSSSGFPRVLAFYYTWYATPEVSGEWRHWNEGGHHPDRRTPSGQADLGATDHPPALYDSHDPQTIRRHLAEARQAGINALISTWWGQGDTSDTAFDLLLKEAEGTDPHSLPVSATVYYENVSESAPNRVAAVVSDFRYLLSRYGSRPAFLRYEGKPVLFVYSRAVGQLKPEEWQAAIRQVKAESPAYVIGDSTDPKLYGVFDALHEYNPVGAVVQKDEMAARYRRLVSDAQAHHAPALVTVIPGYDDSHVGRAHPTVAPREGGLLYRRLWNDALDARPDGVIITSFNEWHEGSEIEPSEEYGDHFLQDTAAFSQLLHSGPSVVLEPSDPNRDALQSWKIEARSGSRLVARSIPRDGVSLRSLGRGPATFTLIPLDGKEPYVFEEGREGRLWRMVSPNASKVAVLSNRRDAFRKRAGEYEYVISSNHPLQAWTRADFLSHHPASPFVGMVERGLHLDLASRWPGEEPRQWHVYPDGGFPLQVTLRNAGDRTLAAGEADLWAAEGWGHSQSPLFTQLRPGESATATLTVRPDPQAVLGKSVPAFVWVRFNDPTTPAPSASSVTGESRLLQFQSSVDLLPIRPVEASFTFGERGVSTLHLKNRFLGRSLSGSVSLRPAEGRSAQGGEGRFTLDDATDLLIRQKLPSAEIPAVKRTYATLTFGRYRQLAPALDTVTAALGAVNDERGVEWIDWDDGRSAPVKGDLAPGRRPVPSKAGDSSYLYFKVSDSLPKVGNTYVQVEYWDDAPGRLTLHYDSTDPKAPLEGRYKDAETVSMDGSKSWKKHVWKLPDARFDGRQNGGADFRLALPATTVIRRVTVSKWEIK